ncbi:CD59 glycoprotein-like isoform X2 [Phyllobates terribilis]|uniref:CD59 glycoprotein-like isoform X2 n=1 Tax=Phyllobates terribilis TaxID=111132 RepID=UPI003CCACECA
MSLCSQELGVLEIISFPSYFGKRTLVNCYLRIMRNPGIGCVLLALGLVFLSLCSTGQAIDCYTCDRWSADQCTISGTCAATDNACMRVTLTDGTSKYSCRVYDKCTSPLVSEENGGIKNFEIKCCQKNLCNSSGLVASPSAVLLLSLAAAALLLLSS